MALGGIMEGLLAAQQISGQQQNQQHKQALLALNQQNQALQRQKTMQQMAVQRLLGSQASSVFGQQPPARWLAEPHAGRLHASRCRRRRRRPFG